MVNGRFDFIFVRFGLRPSSSDWASFAISQIDNYGSKAALVGGRKSGWVKAPNNHAAIEEKIRLAHTHAIQAGTNPHSDDPFDGWGICCSMHELNADLSRFVAQDRLDSLAHWMTVSTSSLEKISSIEYAFAYSGEFPKDGYFGRGMVGGRPSSSLRPLFSDSERVAKWFRAQAWGTTGGYVYDAFPVNVIRNAFLESPERPDMDLRGALSRFGPISPVTDALSIWRLDSEEMRAGASKFLAENRLSVVSHEDNCLSQRRPMRT
jgi:hypothetical protein